MIVLFFMSVGDSLHSSISYLSLYLVPDLGGAGPNVVLCKTCSVLLCVLEQPTVDNSSERPLRRGAQFIPHFKNNVISVVLDI